MNGYDSLTISPDGKTLAICTRPGNEVVLWDLATGKKTAALGSDVLNVRSAAFSPDGKSLVSFGSRPTADGKCEKNSGPYSAVVWDLATQKVRLCIDYPEDVVGGPITPDGKSLILVGYKTGAMFLYDMVTGKPSGPFELAKDYRDIHRLNLSPDGKTLAVSSAAGGILLWDMEKKAARATIPVGNYHDAADVLAFSSDGKTLATAGRLDGLVELWDAATGKPSGRLDFDPRVINIQVIAFSPDGKTIAVGGMRWGVSLWDVTANGERDDFEGDLNVGVVQCLVFTPDGKTLISSGHDKDKAIWFWDVPQVPPAGIKTVGELTPQEAKLLGR
jgi:WD40 repeat protein